MRGWRERTGRFGCGLLAAFFLVASAATGQSAALERSAKNPEVGRPTRYRLRNGLSVVLERDRRQPRVAVVVSYATGSSHDPPGRAGLGHLAEHLSFGGSRHVPRFGAFSLLEQVGATYVNAHTEATRTRFVAVVPSHALATALWIESDRMAFTLEKVTPSLLEVERRIVTNELRQRNDVHHAFEAHVMRALFPVGHRLRPPDDEIGDVQSIELRHVQWFFQNAYRPENATLALVGDFDLARARTLVEQYFGPIVPPPLRRSVPLAVRLKPLSSVRRLIVAAPVTRARMDFVWTGPSEDSLEIPTLWVLARVLETRLRRELVNEARLASSVGVHVARAGEHSLLWAQTHLSVDRQPARLTELVAATVRNLHEQPITNTDLRASKTRIELAFMNELEHLSLRAARLAGTSKRLRSEQLQELQAVKREHVQRAARVFLSLEHRLIAYLRPDPESPRLGEVVEHYE